MCSNDLLSKKDLWLIPQFCENIDSDNLLSLMEEFHRYLKDYLFNGIILNKQEYFDPFSL